jgi:hypothetical protein
MKKIYAIGEEGHPDIAITETFENAIKFLFENEWLDGYTDCYTGVNYYSIWVVLDFNNANDFNYKTFMEKMKNKTEEDIIDFLENCGLYIRQEEIWEPSKN